MLLERDQELGLLADLLVGLATAGGKVVLVRGEAGIGKSSLIGEFINTHADDAHIYFGACDDLLTPQPLGPLRDIAHDQPILAQALADGDRSAVLASSLELLSGSLRPNIMVLEDTQWADEATLDVIKYVGRRVARSNGLLLLTYRDGEVDHDHPLRQVIGELAPQDLARIHLGTLSAEAVASMVVDTDLDADEVLALTDGNPLFVTEVAASGIEKVPSSVQDSVLARAGKLSSGARQLLDLVSVIPGKSERALIENIVDPPQDQMTECARQGLLHVENDKVSFHHDMTRRSVESALSTTDRRRLNAEVLAELGGLSDPARLVHHAREAADVDSIIEFAPKAATAAMASESHREASAHFRTLEPHLDRITEEERAVIVDHWARNEFYLGNAGSLDILNRAIALHRSTRSDLALARALTFAVRVNEIGGRPDAADACAAEAVAILESYPLSGDLAFAVCQHAWLSLMRSDAVRAIELADEAINLAKETGDERTMIHALNTKGTVAYTRGDPGGLELLEESRKRAELHGYPFEETRALLNMTGAALHMHEVKGVEDLAQRAISTAARYELRPLESYAQALYALGLQWKGDWAGAENLASEAAGADSLSEIVSQLVVGTLQARRGHPEARATLDRTWALAEPTGEIQHLGPTAAAEAEYMWLTGDDDPDRIDRLQEILKKAVRLGVYWPAGLLAFWLWELGELSEAPEGVAEPYRLVIAGDPMAAAEMWSAIGSPYEQAIALAHGDHTAQLQALEILERLGATAVAAKLRKSLRDDGVAVPRSKGRDTSRNAAGLTARQAEVLQLLDEGLTNIAIADRLFVSPRTVENHVSAVLTKLGSSTRDEAVSRARDEGLVRTAR